jgi:hypothetical protein
MVWSYACARKQLGHRTMNKARHGCPRKSWFRTGFDLLRNWILHLPGKAADLWAEIWLKPKIALEVAGVV